MLCEEIVYPGNGVKLKAFYHPVSPELPTRVKLPGVVICPGGGYEYCSDREADIVAAQFLAAGFQAFVFSYSVNEDAEYPRPLLELSRAMKDIRANADKWNLDPDKITVGGFSAGGHLAASLGTLWNDPEIMEQSGCENGENKPNLLFLGYPVTTVSWMKLGEEGKNGLSRIIGRKNPDDVIPKIDVTKNIGKQTPPSFIFHTFTDNVVPVEDSLLFAEGLAKNNIPFDLHIFTNGYHGMSIAREPVGCIDWDVSKWVSMCTNWIKRMWKFEGYGATTNPEDRQKLDESYYK